MKRKPLPLKKWNSDLPSQIFRRYENVQCFKKNGTCSVTVLVGGVEAINGVLRDTVAAAWTAALLSSSHLHLTWNYGLLGLLKPVRGFSLHMFIWSFSVAQTTTPLWSSHLYLSSSAAQTAVLLWSPHFHNTSMYDGHLLLSFGGQTHGNHMTKGLGYDILYNHSVCVHAHNRYGFVHEWMYTHKSTLKCICAV